MKQNADFDTTKIITVLRDSGIKKSQAETIVNAIREGREFDLYHLTSIQDQLINQITDSEYNLSQKIHKNSSDIITSINWLDQRIYDHIARAQSKILFNMLAYYLGTAALVLFTFYLLFSRI